MLSSTVKPCRPMYENNVQVEPILLILYSDRIIKQINLMTTINMKGTYIFG